MTVAKKVVLLGEQSLWVAWHFHLVHREIERGGLVSVQIIRIILSIVRKRY